MFLGSSPKELEMIEGFKRSRIRGFKENAFFSQLIGRRTCYLNSLEPNKKASKKSILLAFFVIQNVFTFDYPFLKTNPPQAVLNPYGEMRTEDLG